MIKYLIYVGLGGAAGSMLRFGISQLIKSFGSTNFPWATFLVNIGGCLLMGFLMGYFQKTDTSTLSWQLLLTTGFCGGFTTFSAFAWENFQLYQQGNLTVFTTYIISSILIGILAVLGGFFLSQ